MRFLGEFWAFMRARKKYVLFPVLIATVALAGLVLAAEGSALAPFLYTLF